MTTNEQIMIDGVDVSGCLYFREEDEDLIETVDCSISFHGNCKGYNCHYKQLQRKKAECEEYFKQRNNILEECQRYLEEIRKLQKSQFCVAYEKDCDKDCKQQNCAIKNSYCYRKALDEIEKMIESIITDCDPITPNYRLNQINDRAYDILDIIRKAKGEE